jgi:hypothetical protein
MKKHKIINTINDILRDNLKIEKTYLELFHEKFIKDFRELKNKLLKGKRRSK